MIRCGALERVLKKVAMDYIEILPCHSSGSTQKSWRVCHESW